MNAKMKPSKHKKQEKLYEIAESQHGYFTAKQAKQAGFLPKNFHHHVKTEEWLKEGHGIYRLKNYPSSKYDQLAHYQLWSRNKDDEPQGVYSHETAMSVYELSDLDPVKIHMTVPKTFRKSAETPQILKLHSNDLQEGDINNVEGIRVTSPLRSLIDLILSGETSLEFAEQGFHQALVRGLIRRKNLDSNSIPEEAYHYFMNWLMKKSGASGIGEN